MKFTEPTEDEYKHLAHCFLSFKDLLKDQLNYEVTETKADLYYLQKVIDLNLIDYDDFYLFQGLGLVFGRIIMNIKSGFDWWSVEDEYGKDIVLRLREEKFMFNALNMIALKF